MEKENTACEKGQEVGGRMVEGVERNVSCRESRVYALNNKWLGVGLRECEPVEGLSRGVNDQICL